MLRNRWEWFLAGVAVTLILVGSVQTAFGHTPTVHNQTGTVIGWTHSDHRTDAIGEIACLQNQYGVNRCIDHGNKIYTFVSKFPQVPAVPNPPSWNSTGGLRTVAPGKEWWWSRAVCAGGGEGIALYDNRPFVPGSGPFNFNNFACLGPAERVLNGPFDGNLKFPERLPVETVVLNPPADFIH